MSPNVGTIFPGTVHGCRIYYRSGISIYRYLPAHGGDSPTTAPLTNSKNSNGVSGN
jgi:hypothetical protein